MKILVIDDKANDIQHSRNFTLKILQEAEGIHVDLIEPTEEKLSQYLQKAPEYELIIVDYRFDKPGMFRSGASLYSLIRDYTNDTPIYLISVMTSRSNQIGDFDLFINDKQLQNHKAFKCEIESHISLKQCKKAKELIKLLKAPEEIEEDLFIMLKPLFNREAKQDINSDINEIPESNVNGDLNIQIFSWLVQSLLYKEGPLVSRDGAALLLGVSRDYFDSISEQFKEAEFSGIFRESREERWWGCLLEDHIFQLDDPQKLLSNLTFQEASSKLLGAKECDDFSICVIQGCGGRYPDSLGIIPSDDTKTLYPVHITCSEFNEALIQEPFFRNPRLIPENE